MSTVTALLTNKAYGYPTRGARRRREPTILACLHKTASAKATAMQERNYANRAGSWGPSATAYIDRDGTVVRAIDPAKYAAWNQGDVAHPNTKLPTIAAVRELREAKDDVERTRGERVAAERAIEWLRALSATWTEADVPEAKADVLHAIYDQIVVTGREIVSVRLTSSAYAHGLALALRTKVALARPTGVERADAMTIQIPIEGVDEALAAGNQRLA
jgi:hypothetical protein